MEKVIKIQVTEIRCGRCFEYFDLGMTHQDIAVEWDMLPNDEGTLWMISNVRVVHNYYNCVTWPYWDELYHFANYQMQNNQYVWPKSHHSWRYVEQAVCLFLPAKRVRHILSDKISVKYVTPKIRFDVFKRDSYRCQICGRDAQDGIKLHVDHKVALANGGNSNMDNLWTLCDECNLGKRCKDL